MKNRILFAIILLLTFTLIFSCKKKDDDVNPVNNSLADDLQSMIIKKNVQALEICYTGMSCSQTIGWGTDYSFEGDNIVRVRDEYYNLNKLDYYKIETVKVGSDSEVRMILYFPN